MMDRRRAHFLLGLLCVLLAGCFRGSASESPPIHLNPNMDRQPKFIAQEKSDFFYDGAVMRKPVPGTIARGKLRENEALETGKDGWGYYLSEVPFPVDEAFLARGAERFAIYCTPCHGKEADGRGMLFERAGVKSADLHEERFREMAVGQLYETVTEGKGLMPGYRYPIPLRDRWAIVAHVRQQIQNAGRTP